MTRRAAAIAVENGAKVLADLGPDARLKDELSLTPSARRDLEALLTFSDERAKDVFPTLETIGKHAGGFRPRTVGTSTKELRDKGWLQVIHRPGRANVYRFCIPAKLRAEVRGQSDQARKRGRVTPRQERQPAGPGEVPVGEIAHRDEGTRQEHDAAAPPQAFELGRRRAAAIRADLIGGPRRNGRAPPHR